MEQDTLAVNQPIQTITTDELTHAWKLSTSEEVPVRIGSYVPMSLAELNLKTPLGYQVFNRLTALLPRSDCEHRFKLDGVLLTQVGDAWNPVELPELVEVRASLYRT